MNIELTGIAEKKIKQMAGTACGVLVRNEAGALAAVSDMGRVTWLDDCVLHGNCKGQCVLPDQAARQAPASGEVEPQVVGRVAHLDDGSVICHLNSIGRTLPDNTALYTHPQPAQQGSVPEYKTARDFYESGDFLLSQDLDACEQQAEGWNKCRRAMLATTPQPEGKTDSVYWHFEGSEQDSLETLHNDVQVVISAGTLKGLLDGSTQQGSVPEGWSVDRNNGDLILQKHGDNSYAMRMPEETADTQMAFVTEFLIELLSTTPQPEGDGWIKCSDKLPTEADEDVNGKVWWYRPSVGWQLASANAHLPSDTHWMPTGIKRPQPPIEQEAGQ